MQSTWGCQSPKGGRHTHQKAPPPSRIMLASLASALKPRQPQRAARAMSSVRYSEFGHPLSVLRYVAPARNSAPKRPRRAL